MFNFIKKIFSTKDGSHTVVVINDDGSKSSTSHRLNPYNMWMLFLGIVGGTTCIVVFLIIFTPLGGFIYNEQNVRESVVAIQQKVAALQDTLEARNMQLKQIQEVMVMGKDTSFSAEPVPSAAMENKQTEVPDSEQPPVRSGGADKLPADAILISNLFQRSPQFPAPFPIDGTPTRLFNRSTGHYGMDIAAKEGSVFKAVADGVIINQEWTMNYGYVITVQHSDGVITIYKHAMSTEKELGESILKGDVLGTIGDIGILSSGPHLHIEIWERGIPQDPQNYLINS